MRIPMRAAVVAVALGLVVSGCTSDPQPEETIGLPTPTVEPTDEPGVTAPDTSEEPFDGIEVQGPSEIAYAKSSSMEVFDAPGGEPQQTVSATDVLTVPAATPLVFLVKENEGDWLEVYLPVRPNGSTGWIKSADADVVATDYRVEVSLDDYALTVFKGADEVVTTEIGVGRSDRPTPGGVYYIRELLQLPDPTGVYGPYAYGLSGYSPVLEEFNGGDAVIGMHGTNDPTSFGTDVSSGCIRMPNDVITSIVTEIGLPLGTPVYVTDGDGSEA